MRKVAYLPGGQDRAGVPLLVVPVGPDVAHLCHASESGKKQHNDSFESEMTHLTRDEEEHCQDLDRVLRYLHYVASIKSGSRSFIVILDARQGCWRLLRASIEQVHLTLTSHLVAVWALKPEPFWEKQHVDCVKGRQDCKVQYVSLGKLHKLVEPDQLPEELGGHLPYQHKQWVKNRLRLEAFLKESQMTLTSMEDIRNKLEHGCALQKSDGGFRMIEWMVSVGSLYKNCLIALRQFEQNGRQVHKHLETDDESGFRLTRADGSVTDYTIEVQHQVQEILMKVRADVGQAEQLYAELQCGIQHAREVRRLEAGVEAVTNWVLGPGADLLRQLVLRGIGADPDSVLSLQQDLEHLELKCRDTYAKYAEVRHRLGFLFRSRCILPSDLKSRRSFMDSVCRTFAGLLERRRRVLITSLRFHRLLSDFHSKLAEALRSVQNSGVGEDPTKAETAMTMLDDFQQSIDGLCTEVESEAQRLLDLLVLPPRDAVGRELQGYDHRRERQHVQFLLRRVQDGQGRLQHAWSMERLRLRRIIEISTCEKDSQQALAWLGDLCNVMRTARGRVGCTLNDVQVLKQQQQKFQETARGAYEYGMGLLMAALVLRRSAGLAPDKNRHLAAMLGSIWNRLLAAIREQMTRLRVAGLFYRDVAQHERDLANLVDEEARKTADPQSEWADQSKVTPEAEEVFQTLGRTVRLGRLLQRKILEPLLPGEGFDTCPENHQAVQVISERISRVTDLAHKFDCSLGNHVDSYMDTLEESVADMEEIDVEVGMEEALSSADEYASAKDQTASSKSPSSVSCYQSASDCSCDWSRDASPERLCLKGHNKMGALEQLDMKPMQDFRDYVNLAPTTKYSPTTVERSEKLYLNTSGHSPNSTIGGLSPNSSEDSGFGTTLRVWTPSTEVQDTPLVSRHAPLAAPAVAQARYRNSICYARSASCDSLF